MRPYQIIEQLAATNSRLEKIAILKKTAKEGNKEFFAGVRLALDKDTKFYVKQVPEKSVANATMAPGGLDWPDFAVLADALSSRVVTGSQAKASIVQSMNQASPDQWNLWYRPILRKDLRCGLDLSTLTAALGKESEHHVDSFKCMLAKDSKDRLDKVLVGKKALEIKYDGVRNLAIYDPVRRGVVCYSRNGKIFRNFTKIERSLNTLCAGITEAIVFDGEVVSADFNSLMTQVNRKTDANADDALYVVFDLIPLTEFLAGGTKDSYRDRRLGLCVLLDDRNLKVFSNLTRTEPQYIDFDSPTGMQEFESLKAKVLEAGYEGLIVKDPEAGYVCKRHAAWTKIKPFIEVSLTVKAVNEGEKGTKREGTLGALYCEGVDDGTFIAVNVGSGFTDEMVEDFWKNRKKLIGMIVEIRADAVSQDSEGNNSLRFPRFKCFRGFKKGEKI